MPIRRRTRVRRTAARRAAIRRAAARPASPGADRESVAQSLLGTIGDRRTALGRMTPVGSEPQPEQAPSIPPFVEPAPEASPLPRPAAPTTRRRR